jgi:hypothetical protein
MLAAPYTLRNGTVLATPTAQQILDDRAMVMRAILMRQGIPNNKIIWDRTNMGGFSLRTFTIPATVSGNFLVKHSLFLLLQL